MERPLQHALARSRLLAPREHVAPHAPGGAKLLALDKAVHPLSSARARSPELGAAGGHGSNKGFTGRSVQEGTAVEVQWPSGARAMGYSFIGSYQSVSGALPLCDPRPTGAPGL